MPSPRAALAAVALLVATMVAIPMSAEAQVGATARVIVPPQEFGPMTASRFIEAVNNQATHIQRLNRIPSLPGHQVTVISLNEISPSPTAAGVQSAAERGAGRATVRNAITGHGVVSSALAAGNISVDNVVALAVRGHRLNDVTVYYRP